ncbi:hypothetical protein Tco_0512066 [Tanacetum coccineum]
MRTRSSSNLVGNSSSNPTTSNPKRRNRRRSNQRVEPFALEESPVVTMADQRTMAELLRAPTEGYAEAIDLLRACPHHGFTELHQLDTFYNALNPTRFLEFCRWWQSLGKKYSRCVIHETSDGNSSSSSSSDIAKLTHADDQQTSAVTTAMTAILKQFQATPPPASVNRLEICVTCGGPHPYYQCLAADGNTFPEYQDNIQGYVAAATGNYNQGNAGYRPPSPPPYFLQVWLIKQDHRVLFNKTGKIIKTVLANLKDITEETTSIKIQLINLQFNKTKVFL